MKTRLASFPSKAARQRASILIIVLWVSFGLVSLALYFAHSMSLELRAANHQAAGSQAAMGIEGAARYASNLIASLEAPGQTPDPLTYHYEAVPVGESRFWFIGRAPGRNENLTPVFGLADETAKLNLNTATQEMLERLPRMTPDLAAAIIDWRDEDDEVTPGGAEEETYSRRQPTYKAKNAPFESVEELRLVNGMDLEILYGEDQNRNGVLDLNENDGALSPPPDNRDGRLDAGLIEFLTVSSREPNTRTNGSPRVNLRNTRQELQTLLREKLGAERAMEILGRLQNTLENIDSPLEFYIRGGLNAEEFALIDQDITVSDETFLEGLVNANSAPVEVLACLPGLDSDKAAQLVAQRLNQTDPNASLAWVADVLDEESAFQAGPFLTSHTHQFQVDIAAVGRYGRGYRRVQMILDASQDTPQFLYRRDLTHLGWALGQQIRHELRLAQQQR